MKGSFLFLRANSTHRQKKGFSLVECVLALALFSFAAFAIGQICYNCLYPLDMQDKDGISDATIERAVSAILDVDDYDALDDGIEVDSLDGSTCRVYGECFPTQIIDLFELKIRIESESQDDIEDAVLVIRPKWYENSNDRETLLDDRTDFLEDERLRKAKEIREAEDDEYGSWELSPPKK